MVVRRTRRTPLRGKGIKEWLHKTNNFLKNSKIISKTLFHAGKYGIAPAYGLAGIAKINGYGRKRRVRHSVGAPRHRRTLRGKGKFMDWIRNKALPWLKKTKIISTVGNALAPIPGIGTVAGAIGKVAGVAGYGRRRRVGRPRNTGRRMRGHGRGHLNASRAQSMVSLPGVASTSIGAVMF